MILKNITNVRNKKVKVNDSIWVIVEIEYDGDGSCDSIVGYCSTKQEATAKCKELKKKRKEDEQRWNSYCSKCECGCVAFDSKKSSGIKKSIDKIKKLGCPFSNGIRTEEVFYGKDNKRGGFELKCDKQVTIYGDCDYFAVECKKLK